MRTKIGLGLLFLFITCNCLAQQAPSDPAATKETVKLYHNLNKLTTKGYLIGQQDALAYGVNWKYEDGRSDIKDVTGDQPALFGWELGHIENDAAVNLDTVPFVKIKEYIRQGYNAGSAITLSWHGDNPMTGKTAWDAAPGTVAAILPGGAKHDVFVKDLDKIAAFLGDLKGKHGEAIPIIYRPFHELSGGWFWWGVKSSTPDEFKQLWRFTVEYLRHEKKLHNLIIMYNTAGEFNNEAEFLERYPGDDVVDMISFDTYASGNPAVNKGYVNGLERHLTIIESVAKQKNKIAAIGETGFGKLPYPGWFTNTLVPALQGHQFAYVLFWRNAGFKGKQRSMEYYVPYKGHPDETDFLKFYQLPQTIFQQDAAKLKLYK